jgi:hypothetical protein
VGKRLDARDTRAPSSSTRAVPRASSLALLALALVPACGADPPPPPEAPRVEPPAAPPPKKGCEALVRPLGTLQRLASIVGVGRSMAVRPLHPELFVATLDEVAREASSMVTDDAELAKLGKDVAARLAKVVEAARALAASGADRARLTLLEEMERGELAAVEIEQRCVEGGGTSGGRLSAAAMESGAGRMSAAGLQRALRSGDAAIKRCADAGLRRSPSLSGALRIRFVVAKDGSVTSAVDANAGDPDPLDWGTATDAAPLRDATTIACMLGAFQKIAFPKPKGGTFMATTTIEIGAR